MLTESEKARRAAIVKEVSAIVRGINTKLWARKPEERGPTFYDVSSPISDEVERAVVRNFEAEGWHASYDNMALFFKIF
jgi:hypothetical protein